MSAFQDFDHHVVFEYRPFRPDSDDYTWSGIDIRWARPRFLTMDDPTAFLLEHKQELYDWIDTTYAKGTYIIQGVTTHYYWILRFLEDPHNHNIALFKLRWGHDYDWS